MTAPAPAKGLAHDPASGSAIFTPRYLENRWAQLKSGNGICFARHYIHIPIKNNCRARFDVLEARGGCIVIKVVLNKV